MRNTFVDTIIAAARKREDVFIISGDAGLGVFDDYQKEMPARFLNLGVAEQNAASFTAGMALTGFKMYFYNIIPFLLYRCYEQVRNDICYQKLPVVLAGVGCGLTYAPQGMTHYSVEDLGIAATLPNLTVISPADPLEAQAAAEFSLRAAGPVYVRLAKRGEPRIHKHVIADISAPQLIHKGRRVALVFHGSVAPEVMQAQSALTADGICEPSVISVPTVQPLSVDKLFALLEGYDHVVVIEEHFVSCGLGNVIWRHRIAQQARWKLHMLGIPNCFIHQIKDTAGMREHFGFSAKKICGYVTAHCR